MAKVDGVLFCDRCGAEVSWSPYIVAPAQPGEELAGAVRRGEYCCQDCAEGRVCHCADRMDFDDDRRNPAAGSSGTINISGGW